MEYVFSRSLSRLAGGSFFKVSGTDLAGFWLLAYHQFVAGSLRADSGVVVMDIL